MKAKTKEPSCKDKRRKRKPRLVPASPCQEKRGHAGICGGPIVARSLCWKHLQRFYRHGNTKTVLKPGVKV